MLVVLLPHLPLYKVDIFRDGSAEEPALFFNNVPQLNGTKKTVFARTMVLKESIQIGKMVKLVLLLPFAFSVSPSSQTHLP